MLVHFIKSYSRIILKNKISFFIKSAGTIGSLAVTILIGSYIIDEMKFDRFHSNHESIYRIVTQMNYSGRESTYSRTPLPLHEKLKTLGSVRAVTRMFNREIVVSVPESSDKKFKEPNVWFTDSTLVDIFTFEPIQGSLKRSLDQPNSLLLSRDAALKYFGTTSVIGKTLLFENQIPLQIVAVFENYPDQSTHEIDFVTSFNNFLELEDEGNRQYLTTDWVYTSIFTYVLTHPEVSQQTLNADLLSIRSTIPDDRIRENGKYISQPLNDIHLHSNFTGEQSTPRVVYLFVFMAIGLTLYIISIINYSSLSSSEWINRSRELGVRRMMGSSRTQIGKQFLIESAIFTMVMIPLAFMTAYLLLPLFNEITQKNFSIGELTTLSTATVITLAVICYLLLTSLMLYVTPSISKPVLNVKNLSSRRSKIQTIPASLLIQGVLSFIISVFAIIVNRQLSFIENKPLGYETESLVTIPLFSDNFNSIIGGVDGKMRARMNFFEQEVLNSSAIESISCSAFRPGEGTISALIQTDRLKENDNVFIGLNSVDYDFLETYDIKLLSGRNFSLDFGTDHLQAFIINEEAVELLGFGDAENAIGKNVEVVGKKGQVVGVMQNFHFEGLQNSIRPLLFEVAAWKFSSFSVRLNPDQVQEGIAVLSNKWLEVFPESVFEYHFLENDLAASYQFERSLGKLTQFISILTVILALLGIFAMAIHYAIKRLKEMTIRKVLGASGTNLLYIFCKPFLNVVTLSFILATPLVWNLGMSWLSTFAYHTNIHISDLLIVFGCALVLVGIVLLQQIIKVIQINPVDNIRNE